MLKKVVKNKAKLAKGHRIAIVASRYNSKYVDSMLRAAKKELAQSQVSIEIVRVPGAFEIPTVASALALRLSKPVEAIICLGVIIRGETTHAEHIGNSVTNALMQLQVDHVLPVENIEQAMQRCLDGSCNRGLEAARTAIEMVRIMGRLTA